MKKEVFYKNGYIKFKSWRRSSFVTACFI